MLCRKCDWQGWQEEVGGDERGKVNSHISTQFEFYFKCMRKPFKVFKLQSNIQVKESLQLLHGKWTGKQEQKYGKMMVQGNRCI